MKHGVSASQDMSDILPRGHLLHLVWTTGQRGDAPQAKHLLNQVTLGTTLPLGADAADDSHAIREQSRTLKAGTCILSNLTRKKKREDNERDKHHHVIERVFAESNAAAGW